MIGAEPGQVIADQYELGERLGEGAFGVSFGAVDRRSGVDVVLKIASSESKEVHERLREEGKALAGLHHPRIVAFRGVGAMPDGRPFLVFERVQGESLAERLERAGSLPVERALGAVHALAEALEYAHGRGIIHRDLKPSNVLLPGGDLDAAKLSDFGALGRLEEGAGESRTRTGQLFGTMLYMAPEQLRAEAQTPATDVYGLGALLYEMLFGRPPFHEKRENLSAFFSAIFTESPDIPEEVEVPETVRELLRRMLAKDPQRRPALEEVLNATAGHTGRSPGTAASSSVPASGPASITATLPPDRARGSRMALAIGGALVLLGALVGLGLVVGASPGTARIAGAIALGVILGFSGPLLARQLKHRGDRRLGRAQREANEIVTGVRSPDVLGSTLSRYVQELMEQCKRVDERILGATIARMVADYEAADSFDQRQTALMNAVELLDRLMERLSPWWVRHQKALAFAISFIGVLSGIVSVVAGVSELLAR